MNKHNFLYNALNYLTPMLERYKNPVINKCQLITVGEKRNLLIPLIIIN